MPSEAWMNYPSGKTHLFLLIADPVAHVRAAQFVNPIFESKKLDAFLIPIHVRAADLSDVVPRLAKPRERKGSHHHHTAQGGHCAALLGTGTQCPEVGAVRGWSAIRAFVGRSKRWASPFRQDGVCRENMSSKTGVYAGYVDWMDRPGRFRSPGDGGIDFNLICSKLTQYSYARWASLEWECCLKHPDDGAREGAQFIRDHIIRVQSREFDAGMKDKGSKARNRSILGLG
jgi:hypothetical protein